MTIETRYDIGDEVWVIVENRVQKLRIQECKVSTARATRSEDGKFQVIEYRIVYYFEAGEWASESDLFPTKEELLKSL
jgi:hypothetical protein